MTEIYKIRNFITGKFILDIVENIDIESTYGKEFASFGIAHSFLQSKQELAFTNDVYLDISKYRIEKYCFCYQSSNVAHNLFELSITNLNEDESTIKKIQIILKNSVLNGFNIIPEQIREIVLTHDKYQPIMNSLVPNHMKNLLNEFMNVGINSCSLDVLGEIYLTSTDEQIKMYNMDERFSVHENKTSF